MGAKAWFAAYFDGDPKDILKRAKLDRAASVALAERLLPSAKLVSEEDGSLDFLNPEQGEVFVGIFGDLKIIAHEDFAGDFPSRIDKRWHRPDLGSTVYVHATHSVSDWFAFALLQNGSLVRALSVSPDNGIIEDIGERLSFEEPYWSGSQGLEDEDSYPLPFHPLDLSEEALLENLGFQFEGQPDDWVCDPKEIPILRFQIAQTPWWKFW